MSSNRSILPAYLGSGTAKLKNLIITTLREGEGAAVVGVGDTIVCNVALSILYLHGVTITVWTSIEGDQPFMCRVGCDELITGWDRGAQGMRVKEIRNLQIPFHMAYGERRIAGMPEKADLLLELELLEIRSEPPPGWHEQTLPPRPLEILND